MRGALAVESLKRSGSWPDLVPDCTGYSCTALYCRDWRPVLVASPPRPPATSPFSPPSRSPLPPRTLNCDCTLQGVDLPDTFGPLELTSNGQSHMGFQLAVQAVKVVGGTVQQREKLGIWQACTITNENQIHQNGKIIKWITSCVQAGVPGSLDFLPGMSELISQFRGQTVYRVVTVLQPPFMQYNATTSEYRRTVQLDLQQDVDTFLRMQRFAINMRNFTRKRENK